MGAQGAEGTPAALPRPGPLLPALPLLPPGLQCPVPRRAGLGVPSQEEGWHGSVLARAVSGGLAQRGDPRWSWGWQSSLEALRPEGGTWVLVTY